jgi:hypothetical protein
VVGQGLRSHVCKKARHFVYAVEMVKMLIAHLDDVAAGSSECVVALY